VPRPSGFNSFVNDSDLRARVTELQPSRPDIREAIARANPRIDSATVTV